MTRDLGADGVGLPPASMKWFHKFMEKRSWKVDSRAAGQEIFCLKKKVLLMNSDVRQWMVFLVFVSLFTDDHKTGLITMLKPLGCCPRGFILFSSASNSKVHVTVLNYVTWSRGSSV